MGNESPWYNAARHALLACSVRAHNKLGGTARVALLEADRGARDENYGFNGCCSVQTQLRRGASLKICFSIPPPIGSAGPLPSFTFRQLQIQLRQLVSNLLRQGGQIPAAVCHDFADKPECGVVEKKPVCSGDAWIYKTKRPPSGRETGIRVEETVHPHGWPLRHNGKTHQRQRAVTWRHLPRLRVHSLPPSRQSRRRRGAPWRLPRGTASAANGLRRHKLWLKYNGHILNCRIYPRFEVDSKKGELF